MNIFGRGSRMSINGKTYTGNNITINNNKVYVDGVLQDDFEDEKRMNVKILANVDKIIFEETANINGNVKGNIEAKGDVNCDNVVGDIKAVGGVNCDDIKGDIISSTIINCDKITGSANATIINK